MLFSRPIRLRPWILKAAASVLFVSCALAVSGPGHDPLNVITATWIAGPPSFWNNALRWSSNPCAPSNGCGSNTYIVIINVNSTVALNVPAVVNTFTVGPGTLTTTGAVTLTVLGASTNNSTVTLNPGALLHSGTYTQSAGGALNINISGAASYGKVAAAGPAALAGTVNAGLLYGFVPTIGQTFTIITAPAVVGVFSNNQISINASEHFGVSYTATSVVLTVLSGP
jgi:hypothetical protein